MFTLRLVFYGLIAFVPNTPSYPGEPPDQGMVAILVDTRGILGTDSNPLPEHRPVGLVMEGCLCTDGDCRRCTTGAAAPPLPFDLPRWHHIEFSPDYYYGPWQQQDHMALRWSGERLPLPESALQSQDFSWSPSLDAVAPGGGQVRRECIHHPEYCKVSAAAWLWHGTARACHLAHLREAAANPENPYEGNQPVNAFRFKRAGSEDSVRDVVQAVADAVVVEVPITAGELSILLRPFGSEESTQAYRFTPHNGRLTLVIGNLPTHTANEDRDEASHHFEAFYTLAEELVLDEYRVVPHRLEKMTASEYFAMDCEQEVTALGRHLVELNVEAGRNTGGEGNAASAVVPAPPHSMEVCATGTFLPTALPPPSWAEQVSTTEPPQTPEPASEPSPPAHRRIRRPEPR